MYGRVESLLHFVQSWLGSVIGLTLLALVHGFWLAGHRTSELETNTQDTQGLKIKVRS